MPPLVISLHPSRQLALLLAAMHLLAAGAVLAAALPRVATLALLAGLALSLPLALRRARLPLVLRLDRDGSLVLEEKAGAGGTAQLLPGSALLGGMIFLALAVDGRRRHLLLMPDAAGADELRRLRVWLRWQA